MAPPDARGRATLTGLAASGDDPRKTRGARVEFWGYQTERTAGMRLWHLSVAVLVLGMVMTIARYPAICYGLTLWTMILGVAAIAIASGVALVRTIVSVVTAHGQPDAIRAVLATILVLLVAPTVMIVWVYTCGWLIWVSINLP